MSERGFMTGAALPTLESGRVRLRWLTAADVPSLFTIFGDPVVTRYWGHPVLPDLNAATALLADIHQRFANETLFQWGLELVANRVLIGTCTLASLDRQNRRAELGFALARVYWGNGYMSEALPTLLDFGFTHMQLHRVTADSDPQNQSSIRILERLGFRREGLLREHYLIHGAPQDSIVYGLLRSEWQQGDQTRLNF